MLWVRDEAIEFCTNLWMDLEPAGYYCALTGSLLYRGESKKDLDLIIYPAHANHNAKRELYTPDGDPDLMAALVGFGLKRTHDSTFVRSMWRKKGFTCDKFVEVWRTKGPPRKRLDLFFLT